MNESEVDIEWVVSNKKFPKLIKKTYPDFYNHLQSFPGKKITEKLWRYIYGEPKPCPICGGIPKFIEFNKGFRTYCCRNCQSRATRESAKATMIERYGGVRTQEMVKKQEQTMLEKYGVTNASYIEESIKKRHQTCLKKYGDASYRNPDKAKQTFLEHYGVENPNKLPEIIQKSKRTKLKKYGNENYVNVEKLRKTNLERYGVEYPTQIEFIKDKIKQTNLERYGVHCVFQNPEVQEKIKYTNIKKYGTDNPFASDAIKNKIKQTNLERYGVNYATQNHLIKDKIKQTNIDKYGVPYGFMHQDPKYSKISQKLFNDLKEYFPNAIYATNGGEHRVDQYLLDWYDPDTNTTIEFNGDYWHANPKFYPPDWIHPITQKRADEIWEKDIKKMEYIMSHGIDMYIVWESDYVNGNIKLDEFAQYIKEKHSSNIKPDEYRD